MARSDTPELIFSGKAPSGQFYTDHIENVYFVDGHKIIKMETGTGNIFEYGSFSAGHISSADVSNPFQILIFYRDFNRVVILDNKLSRMRSEIILSDLGIEQASLLCSSGKGGFWVFSDLDNRLVFFDQQLRDSHRSMIISSITGPHDKPLYMTEAQNQLFLYIPRKGILVFDRFGAYLKTVPYSGPESFQVTGEKIVFFHRGELLSMDIANNSITSLDLPGGIKIDNARVEPKRLYILSGNRIMLFRTS
ncbi:MAG: hypothetical protein R6U58_09840 [Bacteroidales bacterium]